MSPPNVPDNLNLGIFSRAFPALNLKAGAPSFPKDNLPSSVKDLQEDIVELTGQNQNNLGLSYRSEQKPGINNRTTVYEIDFESGKGTIKVIDVDTNEEIREIPGENAERVAQIVEDFRDDLP